MGVCDSTSSSRRKKPINQSKSKSSPLNSTSQSDYIISDKYAKHIDILKDYKLTDIILGEGTSGMVCLGNDSMGHKYAVKRINKLSSKYQTQLVKEAKYSTILSHDHIIKCYGIYEDLKMLSFVMELAVGGDLFDFISNAPIGEIPDEASIDIIIQILETLTYLHYANDIVHRDIKPENFMVCVKDGHPIIKLIDFGFATKINHEEGLTDYYGTPQFAAPEIISKTPYNEKVDIWSAGIILYNMLTGYEPFYSEDRTRLNDMILHKEVNFDRIQNEELRALCMGMLTRDPNKRLSSSQALDLAREIKMNHYSKYDNDGLDSVNQATSHQTQAVKSNNNFETICERYRITSEDATQLQYLITEKKIKDLMSFEGFFQIQIIKNQINAFD